MNSNAEAKIAFKKATEAYVLKVCKAGLPECLQQLDVSKELKDEYWQSVCKQGQKVCKDYANQECIGGGTGKCWGSVQKQFNKVGLGTRRPITPRKDEQKSDDRYYFFTFGALFILIVITGLCFYFCSKKKRAYDHAEPDQLQTVKYQGESPSTGIGSVSNAFQLQTPVDINEINVLLKQ